MPYALYYPTFRSKPNLIEQDEHGVRTRYVAEFYAEADATFFLDAIKRAAQLETDNDEMQSYINKIRVALHTEKDELTIDAVRRVISERDALAEQLKQSQITISQARVTIDNLTSPRDDYPYEGDEMDALQREAQS